MHFVATVAKASDLFDFSEEMEIADYWAIQDILESADPEEHFMWGLSCFTVTRDSLSDWDWEPRLKEMVARYMSYHDIEVLVIVTGTDAHLVRFPRRTDE